MTTDFVVVGGGPAGLTVASLLSEGGARVTLLDEQSRDNNGETVTRVGESLPGAAQRLLANLGLPALDEGHHRRISGAISHWAGQIQYQDFILDKEGAGWRLDRPKFEQTLARHACAQGVTVKHGRLQDCRQRQGRWQLDTDRGQHIRTGFVIDATGRTGTVTRRMGIQRVKTRPLVATWTVGDRLEQGTDRTLVETTADGWWYGALLPDGRPLAILHTDAVRAASLKKSPHAWCQRLAGTSLLAQHLDHNGFSQSRVRGVDARGSCLQTTSGDDWAACGDAAQSFDPLSSQGIYNALACAGMLARGLLADNPKQGLRDYSQKLSRVQSVYAHQREAFYRDAREHHQSAFWLGQ
jgi:flavin-dependent dehydrogenase